MMNDQPAVPSAISRTDGDFLDDVLESLMEAAEDGRSPDAEGFIATRPHLRGEIEELAATVCRLNPGTVERYPEFRGYEVLREIGRGGMGTVYLARQQRLGGRIVALKVLGSRAALSRRARDRFRAEAEAVARLRHPNIVAVYDVADESGDACAFSMEWVRGGSLAGVIERVGAACARGSVGDIVRDIGAVRAALAISSLETCVEAGSDAGDIVAARCGGPTAHSDGAGPLPDTSYVHFVCRVGLAIARALGEVHRAGLLHRDVKPSNILIRADGTPLLSDFGLAREAHEPGLTEPGQFIGTAAYASPEQLRGEHETLDARTDVYSLGATLQHALTLCAPFAGRSAAAILLEMEAARSGGVVALGASSPNSGVSAGSGVGGGAHPAMGVHDAARRAERGLPRDLRTIVSKATALEGHRRYQTADEFADDLERFLTCRPIRARRASVIERTGKLLRRNRLSLAGAAVGLSLATVVGVLACVQFLLVPRWKELALRDARLAIIDSSQRSGVQGVVYWGARRRADRLSTPSEAVLAAVAAWDRVPWSAVLSQREKAERDTVRAIARLARGDSTASRLSGLGATSDYLESWRTGRGPPDLGPVLEKCRDQSDRRALGLAAFLCRDWPAAVRVWTSEGEGRTGDPLIDAVLGQLYLEDDKPAKAYVRLDAAIAALPEARGLRMDFADAAAGAGYLDQAAALVDEALAEGRADFFYTAERVRADIHAKRATEALLLGDRAEAERYMRLAESGDESGPRAIGYSMFMRDRFVPAGVLHYARALADWGRDRESLDAYRVVTGTCVDVPRFHREFLRQAERWWNARPPAARVAFVREALEGDCWFSDLAAACVVSAEKDDVVAALPAGVSSPSSGVSLTRVARLLEAHDMEAISRLRAAPPGLKDLAAPALVSPYGGLFARALAVIGVFNGAAPARADDLYRLVDIGPSWGAADTGMNESGYVVGHVGGLYGPAFVWHQDVVQTFGSACTVARDIDSAGLICGWNGCAGSGALFRTPAFTPVMLPSGPGFGGFHDEAQGVNDSGVIAGYFNNNSGYLPCYWLPLGSGAYSAPRNLEMPGGGRTRGATQGITDLGLIVGNVFDETQSGASYRAVIWRPVESGYSAPLELTSPWGRETVACGFNDRDWVVGYVRDAAGGTRAVVWRDGLFEDLGYPGVAYGVSNNGRFVIRTSGAWPSLLLSGVVTPLAGRIRSAEGFRDFVPECINNAGLISGTGTTMSGVSHTVILVPVAPLPCPAGFNTDG